MNIFLFIRDKYFFQQSLRSLLLPWIVLEFVPFAAQLAAIIIVFVYGKDDPILSDGGTYIIAGLGQIVAFGM